MKCREARRLIYLFRENEIPEESRRQLLQHAGSCKRCARELQEAEGARLFLSECQSMEPELNAGRDMTEQIMRSVELAPDHRCPLRRAAGIPFVPTTTVWLHSCRGCHRHRCSSSRTFLTFPALHYLESRLSRPPNVMQVTPEEPHLAAVGFSTIAEISRFLTQLAFNNDSRVPGTPAPQRKRPLLL